MSARIDAALVRLFAAAPVTETVHYAAGGIATLRRKGLVSSERAIGNYWKWRHALTPAGLAERARAMEAHRG